jgi:hypothetical protein
MNQIRVSAIAIVFVAVVQCAIGQSYSVGATVSNSDGQDNNSASNPAYASLPSGSGASAFGTATDLGALAAAAGSSGDHAIGTASRTVSDWTIGGPLGGAGLTTNGSMWLNVAGDLVSDTSYGSASATLYVQVVDISAADPATVFGAQIYFEEEGEGFESNQNEPYVGQYNYGVPGSPEFKSYIESATNNYTNYGQVISEVASGTDVYTDPITWTAGDTYEVTLGLTADAKSDSTQSQGDVADFSDPFSFATNHDVLDLPAGWTVNSPESGVVNNSFNAVPEPATPAVLCFGLLGLAVVRRRARI